MRILIVEDDAAIRELVGLALAEDGHEVLVAPDGATALGLLRRHRPDLILLDAHLPRMDGEAFSRSYREQSDAVAPIVVLTAATDAAERSARIGAVGYLTKPFDLDEMRDLVRRYSHSDRQVVGGA